MSANILVVDDSVFDRVVIQKMLSEYCIITAGNGLEALQQLELHPEIELIILDLNMPVMDGFQFLEELKTNEKYKRFRAIILTNYDEIESEIKGLKLGAIDYIRKPINFDSLKVRISIHLELIKIQRLNDQLLDDRSLTLDTILSRAPIGIAISHNYEHFVTGNEKFIVFNPVFQQITGRTREELMLLGWAQITHPDDVGKDLEYFKSLKDGEINSYEMDKRYIRPDGSITWVHMIVAPLRLEGGKISSHICLVEDITERKEQEMKLQHLSEVFYLTDLYNRPYLESLILKDSAEKDILKKTVVLINIRKTGSLSMSYGYNFSENTIKMTALSLYTLTNISCKLFQISFERFAFYVDSFETQEELISFCNSIFSVLNRIQILSIIGCYIGIVDVNQQNFDADRIMRNASTAADQADLTLTFAYRIFDNELEARSIRETEIKNAMIGVADGTYKDNFYLQYQPILDLNTNKLHGFEALARFKNDSLGYVPPMEFIPIAEGNQLIVPIGRIVI